VQSFPPETSLFFFFFLVPFGAVSEFQLACSLRSSLLLVWGYLRFKIMRIWPWPSVHCWRPFPPFSAKTRVTAFAFSFFCNTSPQRGLYLLTVPPGFDYLSLSFVFPPLAFGIETGLTVSFSPFEPPHLPPRSFQVL